MKKDNFEKLAELFLDTANETAIKTIIENGLCYVPERMVNPNFVGKAPSMDAMMPMVIINNISDMFDEDSYKYIVRQFRNYCVSTKKEGEIIGDFFNKLNECKTIYDILYCMFDHISMLPETKFKNTPVVSICIDGQYDYKNRGLMYNLIFRKY